MLSKSEKRIVSVFKAWAALAWSDGVMKATEKKALLRLLASRNEKNVRAVSAGFVERRVALETAGLETLSKDARMGIYRSAAKLAVVDLEASDPERQLLGRLRVALKLSLADATKAFQGIPELGDPR